MAGTTRLELATSCVTGMRSNQTELRSLILFSLPFDIYYYILLNFFLQELYYKNFSFQAIFHIHLFYQNYGSK